ncbi:orotidine-5'-phosphate decarboxylase [Paenibacillus antri]|uniref:Orotidine 5'-phosphate decarboxylase n=1 Tax=Paenibacillus antri TaxID=2582848 RepID=A0A5R9G297_9BACL|nr:orotidine-5'-phosphate decarboxylase [Paenibacillus antri]TLS50482.1 orotidine-5'-phosphate decarboxylase [Paenibacillus antri]
MRISAAGRDTHPIMVALDVPGADEALALAARFEGIPVWMKVGMELYYAAGPDLVRRLKAQGHRIFLDLKFHDIPNTVRGAARSATRLGVDMFNVHAAGGSAMMRAALEGALEASAGSGDETPLVIAVTQLTSTSEETMRREIGIDAPLADVVLKYARLAKDAGLHGVVSSAQEAAAVKAACGAGFVTVTPGIRPLGADVADQARVMTPADALANGADYLVIGRPITAANDPREALERIVREIGNGNAAQQ